MRELIERRNLLALDQRERGACWCSEVKVGREGGEEEEALAILSLIVV